MAVSLLETYIAATVNSQFKDIPPTEAQFKEIAAKVRENTAGLCAVSDSEYENILHRLMETLVVQMDVGVFINDRNTPHQSWLPGRRASTDFFYWDRYKRYLEQEKHWNPRVTATLDRVSDEILDLMGDPQQREPFLVRGLILGDVQSGKTANYTALANKAADTGYRVIIILAGMLENLRKQTQGRLDKECAGIRSDYYLDPKAATVKKNTAVGVGQIDKRKKIASFTSVTKDFSSDVLKSNSLSLSSISDPVVLVVKKNKKILQNLITWLRNNNTNGVDGQIDLPMLLIDDEADNASVNTKDAEDSPAAINACIRELMHEFTRTTYVGITATPFANIFIDPETEDDMIGDDLFPADFIYALDPPTDYIGAERIFGSENADHDDALVPLYADEMDHFFPFSHKKTLDVPELPPSMKEAIAYFALVNAIRDIRGDVSEHRTMMIHVSRFTDVQNRLREAVYEWFSRLRTDIKFYSKMPLQKAMAIDSIAFTAAVWDKYNLSEAAHITWEECLSHWLTAAISPIEVRAVNKKTGASSLDYFNHPEDGLRVIAVGGNSMSRGITLEGLCVSYFYRRSQMYDTLMQMGRWFGYRPNYQDIFRIWISSEAIDWYGYITRATMELRDEIGKMKEANQTPSDFGLKVRQDPDYSLLVTARNKMRNATPITRPVTVSGHLLETPRLKRGSAVLENNEAVFKRFVEDIAEVGAFSIERSQPYWRGIPKGLVSGLLRNFETSQWHLSFQGRALAEYIDDKMTDQPWDVTLCCKGEGKGLDAPLSLGEGVQPLNITSSEYRKLKVDEKSILISGTKVRVGTVGCTKVGLSEAEIKEAERRFDEKPNPRRKPGAKRHYPDSAYLIKERAPLLMLHIISPYPQSGSPDIEGDPQYAVAIPEHLFALGVGFPDTGDKTATATYMVNVVELRGWLDFDEDDE